jgi:hypothetical protein
VLPKGDKPEHPKVEKPDQTAIKITFDYERVIYNSGKDEDLPI